MQAAGRCWMGFFKLDLTLTESQQLKSERGVCRNLRVNDISLAMDGQNSGVVYRRDACS